MHWSRPLPDWTELASLYSYDPFTGNVIGPRGLVRGGGVQLDNKRYILARIVWKLATGADPEGYVDHVDGDPKNNAWTNLRVVTAAQNSWNRVYRVRGSDFGCPCVGLNKRHPGGKPYMAGIIAGGKRIQLGTFDTLEEAILARKAAEIKYFGEYRTERRK